MKFEDRYHSAVRTSNLKSEEKTMFSASDVLGAAGLAAKTDPLAFALLRMFTGDRHAAGEIIEMLTDKLVGKGYRSGNEIDRVAASLMARLVLDWFRDSVCKACGGLAYRRMEGAPSLSARACGVCEGTGRRSLEALFPDERVDLARWLAVEMERELAKAGPAAMKALAPRLDL
jgi:hypothetical protein